MKVVRTSTACNYNPLAIEDNGTCTYAEENYDCYGSCMIEEDCSGELSDAATALDWLQNQNQDISSCWIGGIDFGAWVGSQLLMRRPEVIGFINIASPLNDFDFSFLSPCPASGLIIHPTKQIEIEQKNIYALTKKLSNHKKIKIVYKKINSDINFKNKENEIKKCSEKFISDVLLDLKTIEFNESS